MLKSKEDVRYMLLRQLDYHPDSPATITQCANEIVRKERRQGAGAPTQTLFYELARFIEEQT